MKKSILNKYAELVVKTGVTYKLECLGCKRQILIDRVEMAKKVKKKLS